MKDNDIFNNCISGVSLERRGQEGDCRGISVRAWEIIVKGGSKGEFTCSTRQHTGFLKGRGLNSWVKGSAQVQQGTSTGPDWPSKFQMQGFSDQWGPSASEGTGAETKHLWVTDLQPHSPGAGAWWESLALCTQNKNVLKVLRGQQQVFVQRYKWEQAQKERFWKYCCWLLKN